jgi:hypothetical protein
MICVTLLFAISLSAATAQAQEEAKAAPKTQSGKNLGEVGAKLSNPLASLWALSMSFNMPQFLDGDVNTGDPEVSATMLFQPVMPIPLYGTGKAEWRLITRPIIPFISHKPIPKDEEGRAIHTPGSTYIFRGSVPEINEFDHKSGMGDIQLPVLLSLPDKYAGKFILGAGPVGLLPTATNDALGQDQWALGPAAVFGYKTKFLTAGVFPNYFWKIGSSGQDKDAPDVSQGSMLYFLTLNLPDAWQVGMNPTITYNSKAKPDDRWNVPVGLYAGKTIKIGKLPVNIKAGLEYSVVSPDAFGQRAQFRFQITPVIPSLIKNPIFGK